MRITLRQIRYFVALAETGKITLAGPAVNVSSSAITEAIQALESETGAKLVERHGKGVKLTAEGHKFLAHCQRILADVTDAMHDMSERPSLLEGRLRVAVSHAVAGFFLPKPLARFRRAHPDVELSVAEMTRNGASAALAEGSVDLAILVTAGPVNGAALEMKSLMSSGRRVWLSPNHALMREDRINLKALAHEPYILLTVADAEENTLRIFEESGIEPPVLLRTNSIDAVRGAVASGLGVSLLPDLIYRPWSLDGDRVEARDLTDAPSPMQISALWNTERQLSPPSRVFLEIVEQFAEEHAGTR